MIKISSAQTKMWSKLGARGTFGVAMYEIADKVENLVVLTADLAQSSGLDRFKKSFPEKFLNTGIAEQNMIGIASGLAKEGKVVFATSFAPFLAFRSSEQIRVGAGYMGFNIKVVGLGSGLAMGYLGNTHYGLEDLAVMRAIPGLVVLSPADGAEIAKTVSAAAQYDGPVYIRLTGAMNNPIVYSEDYDFTIGKSITLRDGNDIAIVATGTMVHASLRAAEILEQQGINATVVNMHTIKPLDVDVIHRLAQNSRLLVTVEEHSVVGGLGSAVAEYKSTLANAPRQLFIGLPDKFGKAGDYHYLLNAYGLTPEGIASRIIADLENWR